MGQLKITDLLVPKSPTARHSRSSFSANHEKRQKRDSQVDVANIFHKGDALSATTPSKKVSRQAPSQSATKPARNSLKSPFAADSVSIPSTPPSPRLTSQSCVLNEDLGQRGEKVPETPKSTSRGRSWRTPTPRTPVRKTPSKFTPSKSTSHAPGSSPFAPIDISSAECSESENERIPHSVSKKRKPVNTTPPLKGRPEKRVKLNGTVSGTKSKPQMKFKLPEELRPSGTAKHRATSLTPRAIRPLQQPESTRVRAASIPRNIGDRSNPTSPMTGLLRLATPQSDNADDSDGIIEKKQELSRKRCQSQPGSIIDKKKQRGKKVAIAATGQAASEVHDSDCEILKIVRTPQKSTLSNKPAHVDSGTKSEHCQKQTGPVTKQRRPPSSSHTIASQTMLSKSRPLVLHSPTKESLMIDLTQDSSSEDSDTSSNVLDQDEVARSIAPSPLKSGNSEQRTQSVTFQHAVTRNKEVARDIGSSSYKLRPSLQRSSDTRKRRSPGVGSSQQCSSEYIPIKREQFLKLERSPELSEQEAHGLNDSWDESEPDSPIIKAEQGSCYDVRLPVNYDGSIDDSEAEDELASLPPPSSQLHTSRESFKSVSNFSRHSRGSPKVPAERPRRGVASVINQKTGPILISNNRSVTDQSQPRLPLTPSNTKRGVQCTQHELFEPCQDNLTSGLKGILKFANSLSNKGIKRNVRFSSPPSREVASSPIERIQHSKQNAKASRSTDTKTIGDAQRDLPGTAKNKKVNTKLTKLPQRRMSPQYASTKGLGGKVERQKGGPRSIGTSTIEPREFMPAVIRDGVSEHAIKSTATWFEEKFAAEIQNQAVAQASFKPDWSTPLLPRRAAQVMQAELTNRGIQSDRQYGNFWYNLSKRFSKYMGSSVPLFSAHKKALEMVVHESMRNERQVQTQLAIERARKAKAKQPVGVDAFRLFGVGETDEDSSSSESSVDGDKLIAKIQESDKKQRLRGVGTSLGR
ncbi:hypothetical protein BGZ63DRAFT_422884 [Mariannaea sp. PMI_226]|nr:hypothetical protein BGZ63DRAFT_422884 [Mariannaea sp. PMI_226]